VDLKKFINRHDKFIFENKVFRVTVLTLCATVVILTYIIFKKIESQKVVVIPPTQTLKEFWVQGDIVSSSYLEMMADVIAYNILNISAEKKFNIEFLLAMVPVEHLNKVKTAINKQMKYVQDNGISQVFYATKYETGHKGYIKVTGLLKQYIGAKEIQSQLHHMIVSYEIKFGRFWITGIKLEKERSSSATNED
jgi:conjugal transfer pilus assembly protein TraE